MSNSELIVNFLGTGTSQGIPVIGCECEVCSSNNIRDNRLRTSIQIKNNDTSIVIDTGPDFRQQMLNLKIKHIDAIIYTHEHKDHVAGLDDIRAFNFIQKKPINIYCTNRVFKALQREYIYIFDDNFNYPGIPKVKKTIIDNNPFTINNLRIVPIEVKHYKLSVLGFRLNDFCYITDANYISDKEKEKMKGLEVLVINALRKEKHPSHFNLEEAISIVNELKPKKAFFTHLSHLMGKHAEISKTLPENIFLSYDGLSLSV